MLATRMLSVVGGFAMEVLFHEDFTIDRAAPLSVPFSADGMGTWTTITNGAEQSISGGFLRCVASGVTDLRSTVSNLAMSNGVVTVFRTPVNNAQKYHTTPSDTSPSFGFNRTDIYLWDGKRLRLAVMPLTGDYYTANGTNRVMFIVDDTLQAVGGFDNTIPSNFYMRVRGTVALTSDTSQVSAKIIHGNWDDIDSMRTNVIASPAAETFTSNKDSHYYFRVDTLPSAGSVSVAFREQDTGNRWEINISSTGGLTLDEVVAGTPTTRITIAGVLSGDVIMCRSNNETIGLMRHVSGLTIVAYAGAVNYKTETAGRIVSLGTGGVLSDFETWDTLVTDEDLARLEAM